MVKSNLSDAIELYIKDVFAMKNNNQIEIRRQDIATKFQCVPSQINYVIKTRFTIAKGYLVESKRGGGGYIRIKRVNQCKVETVEKLLIRIPDKISYEDVQRMMRYLREIQVISGRECEIFLGMVTPNILRSSNEQEIRSRLTKRWLEFLRYDWKEEELK